MGACVAAPGQCSRWLLKGLLTRRRNIRQGEPSAGEVGHLLQQGAGSIATESRKEPSGPAGEHARLTALDTALREARHGLGVVAALSLFLNLLVLVSPLYMFQVFDRVLSSGHVETLVALTVLAGFALLVFGLLETIRHQTLVRIGAWLDRRLSEPVFAASLGEALTGRAIGAEPLRDLARLRAFISSESVLPVLDAPWTLVFIAVIWLLTEPM